MLQPWTCRCGQRNAGPAPCPRCLTPAPPSVLANPVVDPLARAAARPRWFAPLAIVVVLLLVAGGVSAFVVDGPSDHDTGVAARASGRSIVVSPDQPPPQLPGVDGQVAAALPEIMRFVQKARGLNYKRPVKVTLLGDAAFRSRLLDADRPSDEDTRRTKTQERVLQAYGLLPRGVDLEKETESLLGAAVAGYYDTKEDDLVVRGEKLTPFVLITFAHELTHALQDQWFELDRKDLDKRDDESSQAFTAVIEGDAVRIEQLYLDSLPEDQQKKSEEEDAAAGSSISPDVPVILLQLIGFPYAFGPAFTSEVVAKAGQARLDDAFKNPPTTTEEILHPDGYLAGDTPKPVTSPKADKKQIDQGVLGELGLTLVLSRLVDAPVARKAATGWGGDRYVAWRDGDRTCARTNLVMDTETDRAELVTALQDAKKKRKDLQVALSGDVVTFTSCG